ncbi:YddF family protein [Petroclostridium sp. X23]|uniref:YddF family protein n=1 Tax=Petroclostridium sp. X23 TaxID=3045146 RepID=UPI0024AE2FAA|nr:YddF family protein [Petroclostridium sp. X23]WHH59515.1 YddF family protein [Petroclostridium sp. X23]
MVNNGILPIALFNGTVATTNGLYSIEDIDVENAKEYIARNGFISAIGHEATAEIMSDILCTNIPMNRIQFYQQVGQVAIVFKLNERPPEGVILNKEEIQRIGYSLKIMQRLK